MAFVQDNISVFGATQIAVGLSQVIRIQSSPYQETTNIRWLSGGSLEIVPIQFSGASTATGNAWGKGYLLGTTETVPWRGDASIYLAATGATAIVQQYIGYTIGSTFL